MVDSSMLGTRAIVVTPARSATRHMSSRLSHENVPCSPSRMTKSSPATPIRSISAADGKASWLPVAGLPSRIRASILLGRTCVSSRGSAFPGFPHLIGPAGRDELLPVS